MVRVLARGFLVYRFPPTLDSSSRVAKIHERSAIINVPRSPRNVARLIGREIPPSVEFFLRPSFPLVCKIAPVIAPAKSERRRLNAIFFPDS